jgi:hypothetical protein
VPAKIIAADGGRAADAGTGIAGLSVGVHESADQTSRLTCWLAYRHWDEARAVEDRAR